MGDTIDQYFFFLQPGAIPPPSWPLCSRLLPDKAGKHRSLCGFDLCVMIPAEPANLTVTSVDCTLSLSFAVIVLLKITDCVNNKCAVGAVVSVFLWLWSDAHRLAVYARLFP